MLQVARRLRDGSVELVEVPDPRPGPGMVAVRLHASVISSGTERATLEVAGKGLLAKARARPDQARQVVQKARTEGIRSTVAVVKERLEQLGPLGYSAAGEVMAVGEGVRGIAPGDRVAIAGAGFANHAEIDVVPALLCARVPASVSSEEAAFATVGSIALNGFRLGEAQVGATVAVIGLGLIGQLAVRIAAAAGCRVLGTDLDASLLDLARAAGAEALPRPELDSESPWMSTADAVLVCASSSSADPVELAAALARDRGIVVIVGDVRMELPRTPFYEKELQLRLSRSYGPGRYDPNYELHGLDYPLGFVRWTERRNMDAFLGLVEAGGLRPGELITHRFEFEDAQRAFELLLEEHPIAVALGYANADQVARRPPVEEEARPQPQRAPRPRRRPRFGLIGAGSFATATIIPGLSRAGFDPAVVASASGLTAASAQRRFGFAETVSDPAELIGSDEVDLVVVATRHDSHAALTAAALRAGKPVYVEKPLALDWDELLDVRNAQRETGATLIVGFNRRHSPLAGELRELAGPRLMSYRVNAGRLPPEHWTNDPRLGGGRLKGEGCHFIDFLIDQADADPITVSARGFPSSPDLPIESTDNFGIQIGFADGSVGSVHYAADAPTSSGKERFETSSPGAHAEIDDFRTATIWRGGTRRRRGGRQDKGFASQYAMLARVLAGKEEAPHADSFFISTLATLAAARSLGSGVPEPVVESSQLSLR